MRVLKLPLRRVDAVAFSPDGGELAAGGAPRTTRGPGLVVGPTHGPALADHLLTAREVGRLAYTADGRRLLAGLDRVSSLGSVVVSFARPVAAGERTQVLVGDQFAVAGDRLVGVEFVPRSPGWATRFVGRRLRADGTTTPGWEADPGDREMAAGVAALPNGWSVTLGRNMALFGMPRLTLTLRDAGVRPLAVAHPDGTGDVRLLAAPDGDRVVLHAGATAFVWRTDDFSVPPLVLPVGGTHTLAFAPDGRLFAGDRGAVRRLDPITGETRAVFAFGGGAVRSLAVSPDGLTAAAATDRGTVVLFDLD